MKIYFCGSIRGGRGDQKIYHQLIKYLKKHGPVLSEHVGDEKLTLLGETATTVREIWQRDTRWLRQADVVIAEVSTPSLGVGYELGIAEKLGKKVLCLYRPRSGLPLSSIVAGNRYFKVVEYRNLKEAFEHIDKFLERRVGGEDDS